MNARNAARKSATRATSSGRSGSIVLPILIRFAACVASSRGAGQESRRRRLDDRRHPIPARHELLDATPLDGTGDAFADEFGLGDQLLDRAVVEARPVREPRRVDEPREDRVDSDPAPGELDTHGAGERDLGMLRGAVRTGVSRRDRPRDRGDVDDVRRRSRLECGQERP